MTTSASAQPHAALAFNKMAANYDDHFTRSLVGRAQRDAVWSVLAKTFHRGDRILEINCGTGEDALFLSGNGVSVVACDASDQMIRVARQRRLTESPGAPIQFHLLPTELLPKLRSDALFDGVFSNFSGLNCVVDLRRTAANLAALTYPGAPLLICMSTRFCISEMLWHLAHGNPRKAFRRCSGHTTAKVGELSIDVFYPTLRELRSIFGPHFDLRFCTGIGVAVPPSYVEAAIGKHPGLLNSLRSADKLLSRIPGLRVLGDHMLLGFERTNTIAPQTHSSKVQQ